MAEKYVNYVNLSDGTDLLDLRHDSVKPEFLLLGETAHDATGKPIVGELKVDEGVIASGQCGENVFWELYENGLLVISGTGATYDYEYEVNDSPFTYTSSLNIVNVIVENGITALGNDLFRICDTIQNITIPESVIYIKSHTFWGCNKLQYMSFPDNVNFIGEGAFGYCEKLTNIKIPNGITEIKRQTFIGCTNLKSVTIPREVTIVGGSAFNGCNSLEQVFYGGIKSEWELIEIEGSNNALLNATLHCEYDPNADTVDGWNIDVRLDGSDPDDTTKPTISFIFSEG